MACRFPEDSFSNLLKQFNLKEEESRNPISNYHFDKISETLCRDWEFLPSRLDMPEITVSDIKKQNYNSEKGRRRDLFTKWKEMKGSGATYEVLIRALLDADCKNDAEGVCKLLQKSIKTSTSSVKIKSISTCTPPAFSGIYRCSARKSVQLSRFEKLRKLESEACIKGL